MQAVFFFLIFQRAYISAGSRRFDTVRNFYLIDDVAVWSRYMKFQVGYLCFSY